jgi:hypothetical protein
MAAQHWCRCCAPACAPSVLKSLQHHGRQLLQPVTWLLLEGQQLVRGPMRIMLPMRPASRFLCCRNRQQSLCMLLNQCIHCLA